MSASHDIGARFAETHPEDAARVLELAAPEEAADFLASIAISSAAGVVRRMNVGLAAAVVSMVETERAAEIVENLPLDRAVLLLRQLSPAVSDALLELLPESTSRRLRRALRYAEGTAGALADPRVLELPSDISVGEAQKHFRRSAGEAFYNVYVTDREHRLVGVLTIRALLLARPKEALSAAMRSPVIQLPADAAISTVAVHPAWQEFDILPVVDKSGVFLGIVRHKTIRQLAGMGEGPSLVDGIGVVVSIADMYWRATSTLLAGLASMPASQQEDETSR